MSFTRWALPLLLLLCPALAMAQEGFTGYLQPKVSLNYPVTPAYSHNFSVIPRVYFRNEGNTALRTRHLDLSHFSSFRWGPHRSFGFGLLYRFREIFESENENELRLVQQLNFTKRARALRFGHRLRTEQRIQPGSTIHRFRYRFATDGPLQGEKLDVGETYWIGSLESLLSAGKGMGPEYDLRISGWLGYLLRDGLKIQGGVQYRQEDLSNASASVLFVMTSMVLSL